jgi:putative ABC transport system permease protein
MSALERWLARALVRLYPRQFRERYGDEILQCLRWDRQAAAERGNLVRFWTLTVFDSLRTASTERWTRERGSPSQGPSWGSPTGGLAESGRAPVLTAFDLRTAVRGLFRDPAYTGVAILTLALGIGATTSLFTIVNDVLLRPLPLHEPERLVRVYERERDNPDARMVAYGNYAQLRAAGSGFEMLAAWAYASHTLTGVDRAQRLRSREVTANFAVTMGARMTLGRFFDQVEEREAHAVAVLSNGLWQTAFGGDSTIVGRAIQLDGEPFTVLGVTEPGFDFPYGAQLWIPLEPVTDPGGQWRWHRHNMVGRLAPGIDQGEAQARAATVASRLARDHPESNAGNYFELVRLLDDTVGSSRRALTILFGAVLALLLIACVNVAALSVARSVIRRQELAVRTALGASRGRLAALIVIESLTVSLIAGGLGYALSIAGVKTVLSLAGSAIPRAEEIGQGSATVLTFALGAAVLTGLAVSLFPLVWRGAPSRAGESGVDLMGGRASASRSSIRLRRGLVTTQLALAVVLATGAGLLLRSFQRLVSVDPGVETEQVVALNVLLPRGQDTGAAEHAAYVESLTADVARLPGVLEAAATLTEPVNPNGWHNNLTIRDQPRAESELPSISYVVVTADYFDVLGVPVLEGRAFPPEVDPNVPVAVVNRAAAERFWPGRSPIGQLVLGSEDNDRPWATVIGVVGNIRQSLQRPSEPEIYVPLVQEPLRGLVLVVRTRGEPYRTLPRIREVITQLDPDIPITGEGTLADRVATATSAPRMNAVLMTGFAAFALFLACVGVFGVLSYSVVERRREFAIRIAMGAERSDILGQIVRETATMVAVSLAMGMAGALLVARALQRMLFEIPPHDPSTLAVVVVAVFASTLLAGVLPARSATATDPMAILREE